MGGLFSFLKKESIPGLLPTTYNIGLIQTQAFKFVMGITSVYLKQFKLTNVEWVMLGILRDNPKGVRSLSLAETLAVEQAYVTVATRNLIKKRLISSAIDRTDKRAKIMSITKKGLGIVSEVEKNLEKEMDRMAEGIELKDLVAYIKVMNSIAAKLKK